MAAIVRSICCIFGEQSHQIHIAERAGIAARVAAEQNYGADAVAVELGSQLFEVERRVHEYACGWPVSRRDQGDRRRTGT
jgi:hypothetical protein